MVTKEWEQSSKSRNFWMKLDNIPTDIQNPSVAPIGAALYFCKTSVQDGLAGAEGLEPTTLGFGDRCSTN